MNKIPLTEYADIHGITRDTAKQRAQRGSYKTTEKIGRQWFIDPKEPHQDNRLKTGQYKNWRNKNIK